MFRFGVFKVRSIERCFWQITSSPLKDGCISYCEILCITFRKSCGIVAHGARNPFHVRLQEGGKTLQSSCTGKLISSSGIKLWYTGARAARDFLYMIIELI